MSICYYGTEAQANDQGVILAGPFDSEAECEAGCGLDSSSSSKSVSSSSSSKSVSSSSSSNSSSSNSSSSKSVSSSSSSNSSSSNSSSSSSNSSSSNSSSSKSVSSSSSSASSQSDAGFGEASWWQFLAADYNSGAGTTVADAIAANTASFSGSPAWSTDHPSTGYSLAINGDGGLVTASTIVDTRSAFTIFWRVKIRAAANQRILYTDAAGSTADRGLFIRCPSDDAAQMTFYQSGDAANYSFSSVLNSWASMAFTASGGTSGTINFYLNGSVVGSPQTKNQGTTADSSVYYLGRHPSVVTTNAIITDFRLFASELDATAVAAVHADSGPF